MLSDRYVSDSVEFIQNERERAMFEKAIGIINELELWEWLAAFDGSVALTPAAEMQRIWTQFTVRGIPFTTGFYTYIIHNMIYIAVHGFRRWKNAVILDQNEIALREFRKKAMKYGAVNRPI